MLFLPLGQLFKTTAGLRSYTKLSCADLMSGQRTRIMKAVAYTIGTRVWLDVADARAQNSLSQTERGERRPDRGGPSTGRSITHPIRVLHMASPEVPSGSSPPFCPGYPHN